MNGLVAIVDGHNAARQIPAFFRDKGYGCIHIQSTLEPLPGFTRFRDEDYLAALVHAGDVAETIRHLEAAARRLSSTITCVIAGIETGVEVADQLSEAMGLASNGTATGRARRDKYLMAEQLRQQGIPAVQQFKSSDVGEILGWVDKNTTWPVVVKPLDSGGSDGVHICGNDQEVRSAFAAIIGKRNLCGGFNSEALVQAFLKGEEYVINSVSHEGRHYISDLWYGRKRFLPGHGFIYDREELLPFEGPIQAQLTQYIRRVLDALQIKFGPAHSEVMMTQDGPILIEVGTRIGGAVNPTMTDECVGHNQVALTADAYVDGPAFSKTLATAQAVKKYGMLVVLASDREGTLRDASFLDKMRNLPSVRNLNSRLTVGARIKQTVDLATSPGHLHLVNDTRESLEVDYQTIQSILREALESSVDVENGASYHATPAATSKAPRPRARQSGE